MRKVSRRAAVGVAVTGAVAAGVFAGQWLGRTPGTARAATAIAGAPLFNDPDAPVLGNPHGILPMAEFFDYRCPFCRRMHPLVRRLLAEEPDIRFIAKEWPVFGGPSITAARVALAANWQGRFAAVNDALFASAGALDDAAIRAAAVAAGVDMARLDSDLATRSAALQTMLGNVAEQAASLGLQGTPGFVIGSYLVPGALPFADLRRVVAEARAKLQPAR